MAHILPAWISFLVGCWDCDDVSAKGFDATCGASDNDGIWGYSSGGDAASGRGRLLQAEAQAEAEDSSQRIRQAREKRHRLPISRPGIVPDTAYSVTVTLLIRSRAAAPLMSRTSEGGDAGVGLMMLGGLFAGAGWIGVGEIMSGNWL